MKKKLLIKILSAVIAFSVMLPMVTAAAAHSSRSTVHLQAVKAKSLTSSL